MRRLLEYVPHKLYFVWPILVLIGIEIAVFVTNYKAGTWLIGWDSTMPELNFKLHVFRDMSAVWQEYRGVGLLDGMAHGANLVHILYVWILSWFMPANAIRYVLITLGHFLGGLGLYVLLTQTTVIK